VTAFVLEVPSGALADRVSRRNLLVVGSLLIAAGFAAWTVMPTYAGFALGFLLWGTGGALQSGTFEALLYDELAAREATAEYARIQGLARSAGEAGALVGVVTAAPLFAIGGYPLVGAVSVGVAAIQGLIALSLPGVPKVDQPEELELGYLETLKAGVSEAVRNPRVRGATFLAATLFGYTAFDEYFGLIAEEHGAPTATIPLLVGITVVGSLIGSATAGLLSYITARQMAWSVAASAVLIAAGAVIGGWAGFAAIGVSYGLIMNAVVITDARLQDSIEGSTRATITSVSGFLAEVVAVAVFGFVALLTVWFSMTIAVAAFAVPLLLTAVAVRRWLPTR
jgi:MFS family permease